MVPNYLFYFTNRLISFKEQPHGSNKEQNKLEITISLPQ